MRKIPTLFLRDETDRRYVTREVNPTAAWALAGEGVATRKWDGVCTMLDPAGQWWARRTIKPHQTAPPEFVAVTEPDPETGKVEGWLPIELSPFHTIFSAIEDLPAGAGTYELVGPKINGNPDQQPGHALVPHGGLVLGDAPRTYDGLAELLTGSAWHWEGIVWHRGNGDMAKIKQRDMRRM